VRLRFEHMSKVGSDSLQGKPIYNAAFATPAPAPGSTLSPSTAGSGSKSASKQEPSVKKSGSNWPLWTAGAVGIAAVAVGYMVLSEPQRTASASPDTLDLE
jgi:hypothetical protein